MSEWTYHISNRADADLEALPDEVSQRVIEKLRDIVTNQWRHPTDWIESLSGTPYDKIRVGEYRAIVLVILDGQTIEVHRVGHRSSIYDDL